MKAIPLLYLKLKILQNYLNNIPPPLVEGQITTFTNNGLKTFAGNDIVLF